MAMHRSNSLTHEDLQFLGLPITADLDAVYDAWCLNSKRFSSVGVKASDRSNLAFTPEYHKMLSIGQRLRRLLVEAAS